MNPVVPTIHFFLLDAVAVINNVLGGFVVGYLGKSWVLAARKRMQWLAMGTDVQSVSPTHES